MPLNPSLSDVLPFSLLFFPRTSLLSLPFAPPLFPKLRRPQSEPTWPLVHTQLHPPLPDGDSPTAARQASRRLKAHGHLTGSCRQPGVGPWQKASEHEGPQSLAIEPRTDGGGGAAWSKALANAHLASGGKRPCPGPDSFPGGSALGQLETRVAAALDSLGFQGPEQEPQELS